MTTQTINRLNQLNKDFYQTIANDFSETRQNPWQGWHRLVPYIKKLLIINSSLSVLDLACGNARFAEFIAKEFPNHNFKYHGIDSNDELLGLAKKNIYSQFTKIDIIQSLINNSLSKNLQLTTYNLLTAFGFMHHIPSYNLRLQLLKQFSTMVHGSSIIVITFWQFANSERFIKKQIDPKLVGIDPNELEENDFILDWQRGKTAYRYCHFFTDAEIEKLIKESGLKLIDSYNADGKSGKLNKYCILTSNL